MPSVISISICLPRPAFIPALALTYGFNLRQAMTFVDCVLATIWRPRNLACA